VLLQFVRRAMKMCIRELAGDGAHEDHLAVTLLNAQESPLDSVSRESVLYMIIMIRDALDVE
jgi:hypothetical protein